MGGFKNRRQLQRVGIFVILPLALLVFLLVLGGHFAHRNYDVPLFDFFLSVPLGVWTTIGVVAFVLFLTIEILIFLFPALLIRVVELSPETTGPQLHVRCRSCGLIDWVQDDGQRPLVHTCPQCGADGEYGGPATGTKDFIYTQVEVKLGCTKCDTTFLVPEPLTRPLYTECPNCHTRGILKDGQRPVEAEEVELVCYQCSHAFHIYAVEDRWSGHFTCPHCGVENVVPGHGSAAEAPAESPNTP